MGEVLGREQEGGESKDWQFPGNSLSTCSKRKKERGGEGEREGERDCSFAHRNFLVNINRLQSEGVC